MQNSFDLSGKNALVTGGSKGIGLGLARGLAQAGAHVVIANRSSDEGHAAAERLTSEGLDVQFLQVDISDLTSIRSLFDNLFKLVPQLDILVNNAGIIIRKQAIDYTEEDWDKTLNVNLKGTFFCSQLAASDMRKRHYGKIINTTSVLSQMCQSGRSVYSVTKAGIMHMTKALAMEWSPWGINVNAMGPGCTKTELNEQHFRDHPDDLANILKGIPMGRQGIPADCAGAVVFLASSAADYITGQTILVDGGMICA